MPQRNQRQRNQPQPNQNVNQQRQGNPNQGGNPNNPGNRQGAPPPQNNNGGGGRKKLLLGFLGVVLVAGLGIGAYFILTGSPVKISSVESPSTSYLGQEATFEMEVENTKKERFDARFVAKSGSSEIAEKETQLSSGDNTVPLRIPFESAGEKNIQLQVYKDGELVSETEKNLEVKKPEIESLNYPEEVIAGDVPVFKPDIKYETPKQLFVEAEINVNGETTTENVSLSQNFQYKRDISEMLEPGTNTLSLNLIYDGNTVSTQTKTFTLKTPQVETSLNTQQKKGTYLNLKSGEEKSFQYADFTYSIENVGDVPARNLSYAITVHTSSTETIINQTENLESGESKSFENSDVKEDLLSKEYDGVYGDKVKRPADKYNKLFQPMVGSETLLINTYYHSEGAWTGSSQLEEALLDPQERLLRGIPVYSKNDIGKTYLKMEVNVPGQEDNIVKEESFQLERPDN